MKKRRAERRAKDREGRKLTRDLDRLAKLAPGGAPERPLRIVTPSEVEVHVASARCPLCEGRLKLDEHAANTIRGRRLRVAKTVCDVCGARREIYFELEGAALN